MCMSLTTSPGKLHDASPPTPPSGDVTRCRHWLETGENLKENGVEGVISRLVVLALEARVQHVRKAIPA